jgi:3-methyladenine DNA glycosylase AlkD
VKDSTANDVQSALKWLKDRSTKKTLDGMARYAIPSNRALGVAMRDIKLLGTKLGKHQVLANALWDTEVYEARMLASFVGDPEKITARQMDRTRSWR